MAELGIIVTDRGLPFSHELRTGTSDFGRKRNGGNGKDCGPATFRRGSMKADDNRLPFPPRFCLNDVAGDSR
jgi:hypothetical protein